MKIADNPHFVLSEDSGTVEHLLQHFTVHEDEILDIVPYRWSKLGTPTTYGIYRRSPYATHGFIPRKEFVQRIESQTSKSFNKLLEYIYAFEDF